MRAFSHFFPAALLALICTLSIAEEAGDKKLKMSVFAPAKETEAQLKYYLDKIEKDLANKEDYSEAEQKRVGLDASTVAVLGLVLGHHDEKTTFKQGASTLIELAGELAANSDDYESANEALGNLKKVVAKPVKGEAVAWEEPVADLAMLMQQVPIVNASLRKAVNGRRFSRDAKRSAGRAVTLAVIAQASMMDTSYCGDEEDEKAWQKICADMRDACSEVYKAMLDKDQKRAKAANAKVVETCDACHHKFRD